MKVKVFGTQRSVGMGGTVGTQRTWIVKGKWAIVGGVLFLLVFIGIFVAVFGALKGSEAYKMTVVLLNSSPKAIQRLGQPISTGTPTGSMNVSGSSGAASLSFSATGPQGHGTVYVEASKLHDQWNLDQVILSDASTGQQFDLVE
jgi:hypothetical protein